MSHPDRLLNCAVKHDCEPKAVLHIANAMDNALPTALTGTLTRRTYHNTLPSESGKNIANSFQG